MNRRSTDCHISSKTKFFSGVQGPCDPNGNLVHRRQHVKLLTDICSFVVVVFHPYLRDLLKYWVETQNKPQPERLIQLKISPITEKQIHAVARQDPRLKFDSIVSIQSSAMLQYSFTSTYERRSTSVEKVPYDGPLPVSRSHRSHQQPISSCWNVDVEIPKYCRPKSIEMPGSVEILRCPSCKGDKNVICVKCGGNGTKKCTNCHGYGEHDCYECYSRGFLPCDACSGNRLVGCKSCKERGKIKQCIQLTVKWNKKTAYSYCGNTWNLPQDFLKNCTSTPIYRNAPPSGHINPLTTKECLNQGLVRKSQAIVREHQQAARSEVILRNQEDQIGVLPHHKIVVQRNGIKTKFWIGGTNKQLYYPKPKINGCCCIA